MEDASCAKCVQGRYQSLDQGIKACEVWSKCEKGRYPVGGSADQDTTCKDCASGFFQPDNDQSIACTEWKRCDSGFGRVDGSDITDAACQECATGKYQEEDNAAATCKPWRTCSAGFGPQDGSPAQNVKCIACISGMYQQQNQATKPCSPWSKCDKGTGFEGEGTSISNTNCQKCEKGKYQEQGGVHKACKPCLAGKHSSTIGAKSVEDCLDCPGQTYSPDKGFSGECLNCNAGQYSTPGSVACSDTPPWIYITATVVSMLAIMGIGFTVLYCKKLRKNEADEATIAEDSLKEGYNLELQRVINPLEQTQFAIAPEDLHLKQRIGAGGCGWIYKAHLGGASTVVAAKEIISAAIDPEDIIEFEHEARMLTQMNHPNVLRVLGFCTKPAEDNDDNQEHKYIVTGNFTNFIKFSHFPILYQVLILPIL